LEIEKKQERSPGDEFLLPIHDVPFGNVPHLPSGDYGNKTKLDNTSIEKKTLFPPGSPGYCLYRQLSISGQFSGSPAQSVI
jgi:hypothetical protein